MNERQTIRALRDRDPQGITAVYDRYAEGLYDYCWWLLRDHGTAREALHDALLATGVHVDALRSPERLRPWLYALVRTECLRRSPATPRTEEGDDAIPDASELRSLAWKATEAVPPAESDALELHVRHGLECADLAAILRRPSGEVQHLLERAHTRVGQALRVEMLARTGPTECSELAALLDDSGRRSAADHYAAIDRHARACSRCSERVPRRVSVSRLMALLPTVTPPADLRQRIIDAYAEPDLLEYRLLAARRLQPLGRDGFPQRGNRRGRRSSRGVAALATVTGLVVAVLCAAAGAAVLRFDPFSARADSRSDDGGLTYEEVGAQPGADGGGSGARTASPGSAARKASGRSGHASGAMLQPGFGRSAPTALAMPDVLPVDNVLAAPGVGGLLGGGYTSSADPSGGGGASYGAPPPTNGGGRADSRRGTHPGSATPPRGESPSGGSSDQSSSPSPTDPPSSTETGSPSPTDTGSPSPTETGSPSPTETGSPSPTDTGSPSPTETASPRPTGSGSPSASEPGSPSPSGT